MLFPQVLRELQLPPGVHPEQRSWLSAASGLVLVGEHVHVVADDEHHLCSFAFVAASAAHYKSPLQLLQLLPGELPQAPKPRKKTKPDLETLLWLPPAADYQHGSLLCLGSGGKTNRRRALQVPLCADGAAAGIATCHDFGNFFDSLGQHFDDLNIEGGFINGHSLTLLQRGNKGKHSQSACIQFELAGFLAWLDGKSKQLPAVQSVLPLDFGSVQGVPLCPTDGAALLNGGWVVTLVAEDTRDSISDGKCVASALAIMTADNQISVLHRLHGDPKTEGVAVLPAAATQHGLQVLLVTDADDPQQCSQLLQVQLP